MTLAIIYARSRNFCIGKDGDLPWDLPAEFALFEAVTRGHPVIMGRKTYEDHESALEERLNIVISSSRSNFADGVEVVGSLKEAVMLAREHDEVAFVIGGSGLIRDALPDADIVYESIVDAEIEGDVFIDAFDFSAWHTEVIKTGQPDSDHAYGFESLLHRRN